MAVIFFVECIFCYILGMVDSPATRRDGERYLDTHLVVISGIWLIFLN